MVLSQEDIRKAIKKGDVLFSPELEETQYGQASVDLRLGFTFTKFKKLPGIKISVANGLGAIGDSTFWETMVKGETNVHGQRETYTLEPGDFVLGMTYESITIPPYLIALVEGRSTYARVGLSMHLTAPWIQPGWSGPIILEMTNNGPLSIELTPRIDRPCQLTFLRLTKSVPQHLAYGGNRATDVYQHQAHPLDTRKKSPKVAPTNSRPGNPKPKRRR